MRGVSYPAGDFLVVENPDKPSTWHLQVRRNGRPVPRLMGAAHAALTVGYRGNRYQGPNKQAALAQLRRLYQQEQHPWPTRKGTPRGAVPRGETRKTEKELVGRMLVFKDKEGQARWLSVSSGAFYPDRDGEGITTAALEEAVRRMEARGSYGILDWWHIEPAVIGDCDWSCVLSRSLVESGTFRQPWLADVVASEPAATSLTFYGIPDQDGWYHDIDIVRRAALPAGQNAYPLATLAVMKGINTMDWRQKLNVLLQRAPDEAQATVVDFVEDVLAREKAAGQMGLVSKEDDTQSAKADDDMGTGKSKMIEPEDSAADESADEADETVYVSDLSLDQLEEWLMACLDAKLDPIVRLISAYHADMKDYPQKMVEVLDVEEKMRRLQDGMQTDLDEIKGLVTGYRRDKEAGADQTDRRLLEIQANLETHLKYLRSQSDVILGQEARLKSLEGGTPDAATWAFGGTFRASDNGNSVLERLPVGEQLKNARPATPQELASSTDWEWLAQP